MSVGMFQLSDEEIALQEVIRKFAQEEIKPHALEMDRAPEGTVNWDLVKKACELGMLSGFLPRRYGGTMTGIGACLSIEELCAVDAGFGLLMAINGMGIATVAMSGDKKLADRFFPPIIEGESKKEPVFCGYAITEPNAGSDVEDNRGAKKAKLITTAKKVGDKYIINGRKCFCSAGNIADWVAVFATLDKDEGVDAWTCFIVEKDMPGFSVGTIEDKMGQRACPAAELIFEDVEVPEENRVGVEKGGWQLNHDILSVSRPTVGAFGVGIARGAYDAALKYATERYQGEKQIIEHQMIQQMLADMAIKIEAARLLCWKAATTRPASMKFSSMAKVFGTDMSMEVCSDAIQILGGYGYMKDYGVEKYLRDAKVNQIMEGTNQVCRLAIMEGIMEEIGYEYKY
jgi:acyl-CoA dehydrogenase